MSKKRDFFKRSKPSKPSTKLKETSAKLNTLSSSREMDRSMISVNTSHLNSTFMDDFSQGFNSIWNKLLSKFHSKNNIKSNNILDSLGQK